MYTKSFIVGIVINIKTAVVFFSLGATINAKKN